MELILGTCLGLVALYGVARRRRRGARTPAPPAWRPIGEAPDGPQVAITGEVAPGPVLIAPLSGRPCVLYEVTVTETYDDGTVTVVRERGGDALRVRDATGCALIEPAGAELDVVPHHVRRIERGEPVPAAEAALLARHAGRGGGPVAIPPLVCCERVLVAGDPVAIVGPALREPDPDGAARADGYRGDAPTRLRFASAGWDRVRIQGLPR